MQSPADRLASSGHWLCGDCAALMRPVDALAYPCGAWYGYRKHEKTGGRVSASCLFGFRVRLWVGWVLPYLYLPLAGGFLFPQLRGKLKS